MDFGGVGKHHGIGSNMFKRVFHAYQRPKDRSFGSGGFRALWSCPGGLTNSGCAGISSAQTGAAQWCGEADSWIGLRASGTVGNVNCIFVTGDVSLCAFSAGETLPSGYSVQ